MARCWYTQKRNYFRNQDKLDLPFQAAERQLTPRKGKSSISRLNIL